MPRPAPLEERLRTCLNRHPEWEDKRITAAIRGAWGPVVDHDHSSGIVRGILCQPCNLAAGMLRDDPGRANNLAQYLGRRKR
jgi:hypothetical protein